MGPRVQTHSRCFLRLPATGVSGHWSLSESSESEDRLSPVLGDRARRVTRLEDLGLVDLSDTARVKLFEDVVGSFELVVVADCSAGSSAGSSSSECATVYFVVCISSSSGALKDTLFCGGNIGRFAAVDMPARRSGLFCRQDRRLKFCL